MNSIEGETMADLLRTRDELAKHGPSCDHCQSSHCCSVAGCTPPLCVTDPDGSLPLWMPWTNEEVRKRIDAVYAQVDALQAELSKARNLIGIALPHVQASAGAEHMLDGFRPRRRPIDDDVDAIRAALANNAKDGEVALGPWIPTSERLPEKPGKKSYEYVWCLVHHPNEGILLRPWNCEHLVWDDEQMDDFWCNPRDVTHWIPIAPLEDSIRAALANNAKDEA